MKKTWINRPHKGDVVWLEMKSGLKVVGYYYGSDKEKYYLSQDNCAGHEIHVTKKNVYQGNTILRT